MRKLTIFILSIAVCSSAWAQSQELALGGEYLEIYQATEKVLENDPLLQNGLYYAYPYYSALGNPFLGDGEFEPGTVIFKEKSYEGIRINYDIFNQQVILSRKTGDMLLMNLMANEFISGFSFKENRVVVKEASDREMLVLIEYCNSILDWDSKLGGE